LQFGSTIRQVNADTESIGMEVVEVFEDKGFFKGSPVEGLSIVLTVNFYWLLLGDKTHP